MDNAWGPILTGNDDEGDDEPNVDETDEDDLANDEQHPLQQEFQEEWHTNIHCAGRQEELTDWWVGATRLCGEKAAWVNG